ncbi:hypothetical protein BDZ45DRAFT_743287 [Acephala macrosclerotiorum]|nr:hypothetical protein BDZ45DRAFT_743287 [Acephala macrosclerotiorum]
MRISTVRLVGIATGENVVCGAALKTSLRFANWILLYTTEDNLLYTQENGGIDTGNCCLCQKCSDLLEDESDIWALDITEEFPVKSEQPRISSPIAPGLEPARSQFEVAEFPHLSLSKCMTSAPIARNSLRKHTLEIYACSFFNKTFSRKGDWKRHEESLTSRKSNGVVWSQVVIASFRPGINFDSIIRTTMDVKIANTIQMQLSGQSPKLYSRGDMVSALPS